MTLQWEHVDITGKALRLPDSKTGAKVAHLGQPAVEVLEHIPNSDPPRVRVISDNPLYKPYEGSGEEVTLSDVSDGSRGRYESKSAMQMGSIIRRVIRWRTGI